MQEHVAKALEWNFNLLKMHLADFSDSDMLTRPVPGANHTAWQVGHLICFENRVVKAVGGSMPDLPDGFEQEYSKETAKSDDPAQFDQKDSLISLYDRQRKATIAWATSLKAEDLDRATPEGLRNLVPNIAAVLDLISSHVTMHVGQIQVIRRKLGKPVLF